MSKSGITWTSNRFSSTLNIEVQLTESDLLDFTLASPFNKAIIDFHNANPTGSGVALVASEVLRFLERRASVGKAPL